MWLLELWLDTVLAKLCVSSEFANELWWDSKVYLCKLLLFANTWLDRELCADELGNCATEPELKLARELEELEFRLGFKLGNGLDDADCAVLDLYFDLIFAKVDDDDDDDDDNDNDNADLF